MGVFEPRKLARDVYSALLASLNWWRVWKEEIEDERSWKEAAWGYTGGERRVTVHATRVARTGHVLFLREMRFEEGPQERRMLR